tara:strand:- start:398 stop:2704 length:2307 start_codon:yes stop_codon:yes gene_type:complete
MDQTTNKSLGKSFNSTMKGYDKLKSVLSAPLSNQLMSGMGGLSGIDAMIQQTQNLHNMGKANRMEVIAQQQQIVASSKKNVEVAAAEVTKLEASGKLQTKKGQKAADNLNNAIKEEQQQKRILDNLRFMNREIDIKNSKMKEATMKAQQFAQNMLNTADAVRQKFNTAIRNTAMLLTAVGFKLQQNTRDLMEFERELLNANSVFNLTNTDLFNVGQSLIEFGNEFGITTQNASAGLYQLASAGVTAQEAMEILPSTLKLSMAVQGDHNTISKLTAQTLFGFGMEMDQAALLTDKFAFAIQKSLIEYQDLSSAVKFALPFFTSTGQSIDQLLGALQILTNRALEAGIAGRGLRQALAEFAESALDAEVGFRKMGVEILNSQGEMLQLSEIAAQFAAAVGPETASNTELLTTLIQDLNVRGATAFIHLVQASDEFTQAVKDTENAGGQLDEMVKIQNASLTAQIQILKNNIMAIFAFRDAAFEGTEFLNGFHEAVHNLVDGFKNQIIVTKDGRQELTAFGKDIQQFAIGAMEGFAEMLVKVIAAFQALMEHQETFVQLFKIMTRFFSVLSDVIITLAQTNIPILNRSLLEVLATLKLISMLGIFSAAGSLFNLMGGFAGIKTLAHFTTRAGGITAAGTVAGGLNRMGLGGIATRTLGHQGGRAMLGRGIIAGATRLGATALLGTGVGGAILGGAYLADRAGLIDVPFMANGGYMNRANGGPVVVGEQGPELFIPGQSGQVLNNAETNNMMEKDVVFRNARISIDSFGGLA